MIKKNSWIVALILALSLTVFFGCVDGFVPEVDEDTYTEFELKEFNTRGGQAYQRGWANDGSEWGDPEHTAQAIGLDLETLQKARYLEFDLDVDSLAGAMDVILGGDNKGWNQTNSVLAGGASGTQKIDLSLLTGYSDFVNAKDKARIVIQYNQAVQGNTDVMKRPRLLISDKKPDVEIIPPPVPHNPDCRDPNCAKGEACDNTLPTTYTVPAGGDDYFFINLNDWNTVGKGGPNETLPTGALTAANVTLGFVEENQRAIFKFSDEQLVRILDSGKIKFEIVGTATPDQNFRYHLGNPFSTSNWNATGGTAGNNALFSALLDVGELDYTGNFSPTTAQYFILQNRAGAATSVVITSIKVTLLPAQKVTNINFSLDAPVAGLKAKTTVEGTGFTGKITWVPAIPADEKYAVSTIYYANVAITAKAGFALAIDAASQVNSGAAFFNPATKVVTTDYFPRTASKPAVLKAGELFKLSTSGVLAAGSLTGSPLKVDGGTFTVTPANGVMFTVRTADWNGLDIKLNEIDIGIVPANFKVKVTIRGALTADAVDPANPSNVGVRLHTQGAATYAWLESSPAKGAAGFLQNNGDEFEIIIADIPATFTDPTLRICTMGASNAAGTYPNALFKITEIIIENLGER